MSVPYSITTACREIDHLYHVIAQQDDDLDAYRRSADVDAETVGKLLAERLELIAERDALRTELDTVKAQASQKSWRGW